MKEIEYRDVLGFPGYRVGSDGTIWTRRWTLARRVFSLAAEWRIKKSILQKNGYYRVKLFNGSGKSRYCLVHRIVLEAFVGLCPEGMEACHNNGIRSDNRISNLRWGTRKENHADKKDHGTHQSGEKNGFHKLTDVSVMEIRRKSRSGVTGRQLANEYEVSFSLISQVVRRQIWKHI